MSMSVGCNCVFCETFRSNVARAEAEARIEIAAEKENLALRNTEQEKRTKIDAERGIYPDVAPAPVHSMEPETPAEPKKGGYATLMTARETDFLGIFPPETDEERELRRNQEWAEFNAAVKQMAEDQKTQPMSATAAVARQAEENKGKFRMRVEARLDELNFVSAMAWEINQKDWFKRRVEELLEMLK